MQPRVETSVCLLCQRVEILATASWCMALDHLRETRHAAESQQRITVLVDGGILTPIAPHLQDACRSETMRAVPTNSACPVAIVSSREPKNLWAAERLWGTT
jgi:hypothetical protein